MEAVPTFVCCPLITVTLARVPTTTTLLPIEKLAYQIAQEANLNAEIIVVSPVCGDATQKMTVETTAMKMQIVPKESADEVICFCWIHFLMNCHNFNESVFT